MNQTQNTLNRFFFLKVQSSLLGNKRKPDNMQYFGTSVFIISEITINVPFYQEVNVNIVMVFIYCQVIMIIYLFMNVLINVLFFFFYFTAKTVSELGKDSVASTAVDLFNQAGLGSHLAVNERVTVIAPHNNAFKGLSFYYFYLL